MNSAGQATEREDHGRRGTSINMECNHVAFQAIGEQGRLGKRPEHIQERAWLRNCTKRQSRHAGSCTNAEGQGFVLLWLKLLGWASVFFAGGWRC
jgi:hypothetical protein